MPHGNAKRIILRFNVEYDREHTAIIEAFFASHGPKPAKDYYSHIWDANGSSKMHIILDIHCKSNPTVDPNLIEYQVFKVHKVNDFTFTQLGDMACSEARRRTHLIPWGTDRSHPEEFEGDHLVQVGQSPATFVS